MLNSLTLAELANRHGSDRGTKISFRHNYAALYDLLFFPLKTNRLKFLEIGLAIGGPEGGGPVERQVDSPSVKMWLDYFPYGDIYGFDISDFSHIRDPRFHFTRGDAGSTDDWARLKASTPPFDIIVDDGSHASFHQQCALAALYDHLAPGGLYIIEGLHWQSPVFEPQLPAVPKTADLLQAAMIEGQDVQSVALSRQGLLDIRQATQSFAIFPSFTDTDQARSKIAVFRKADQFTLLQRSAAAGGRDRVLREVRSFDMFDTLVARRCVEPHAVLHMVERRIGMQGFAALRIAAESSVGSGQYTIADIYRCLHTAHNIPEDDARRYMKMELAAEDDMLFGVAENCAAFSEGDVVVSDMYLPEDFILDILRRKCQINPARLYLSSHGKMSGRIWPIIQQEFRITEHLGDNEYSDIASASNAGIPARLTHVAERSEIETELTQLGLAPLANLIREARLRTFSPVAAERTIQLLQIQLNFPLLFLSTLELVRHAEQRGWRNVLLSGRDCFLWNELYQALYPRLDNAPPSTYFYSSRLSRMEPSGDYLAYFQRLRGLGPSVVVDLVGTGWSLTRLIERGAARQVDIFLVHELDRPDVKGAYEVHAPTQGTVTPISIMRRGMVADENEVLEELNRAPHPMLADMVATRTGFRPSFVSNTATIEIGQQTILDLHHAAFRVCIDLLKHLTADDLRHLRDAAGAHSVVALYRHFEGRLDSLDHFRAEKTLDEQAVQEKLHKLGAAAAPHLSPAA